MSSTHHFRSASSLLAAQYAVTLGVVRAVERELPQLSGVLRIKWPNDIYVLRPQPVKIGGVLVQSSCIAPSASSHGSCTPSFRIVAGVGLNVSNSHPTLCLADLCNPAPPTLDVGAMCGAVFQELVLALRALDDGGLPAIQQEYERRWLHSEQRVQVAVPASDGAGAGSAVIKGLSASGFILADMQGVSVELHPDSTSMDMTQRLLYAKRL